MQAHCVAECAKLFSGHASQRADPAWATDVEVHFKHSVMPCSFV